MMSKGRGRLPAWDGKESERTQSCTMGNVLALSRDRFYITKDLKTLKNYVCVCVSVSLSVDARGDQKMALQTLELELRACEL